MATMQPPDVFSRAPSPAPSQLHSYDNTAAATGNNTPSLSSSSVTSSASMKQVKNKLNSLPPRSLSEKFLESMVTLSALANANKDGRFPSTESENSFIETLSELPIFKSIPDYIKAAPVARNAAAAKAERDAKEADAAKEAEAAKAAASTPAGLAARFKREQAVKNAVDKAEALAKAATEAIQAADAVDPADHDRKAAAEAAASAASAAADDAWDAADAAKAAAAG